MSYNGGERRVFTLNYKEMKMRPINSKKDAIIFLNQMIVLVDKRMIRLKNAINDTKKLLEEYDNKDKIETTLYQAYAERMESLTMYLCNLLGDETKNAVSYRQFRKIMDKKAAQGNEEFRLDPLDKEMIELLDSMREQRNWAHHIPQSLFASQENFIVNEQKMNKALFEKVFSDKEVYVSIWEYHDIKWLINMYASAEMAYANYKKVFQRMKKDYSALIGCHMRITRMYEPIPRPAEFSQIAETSLKVNSRRN